MIKCCFISKLEQLIQNFALTRNRYKFKFKLILLLFMVLLFEAVFYYLINKSTKKADHSNNFYAPNVENDNSIVYINKELNDSNVDTSNYVNDYYLLRHKLKPKLNLLQNRSFELNYKNVKPNKRDSSSLNQKSYFIYQYANIFSKQTHFNSLKECPYKNCQFVYNKSLASTSDVILIKEDEFSAEAKHFLNRLNKSNKLWVLWNDQHSAIPNELNAYKFNWTLSFRLDAEVSDCYSGCYYTKTNTNSTGFMGYIRAEFNARKSQALWVFNRCYQTNYIYYVLGIKANFPVKIHGKCSNEIEMAKQNSYNIRFELKSLSLLAQSVYRLVNNAFLGAKQANLCGLNTKCEYDEFRRNMFYILAEDKSNKMALNNEFWRILRAGMIPIVFEPSKEFYELLAPGDSFVHASDFWNYYELACYMERVSLDFELYLKHHMWRLDHDVVYSKPSTQSRRLCELCTKLNTETSVIYYENIVDWFGSV